MKNRFAQRYRLSSSGILILLVLFLSGVAGKPAHADSWSFFWENDALVGTDQHYTNGIGVSWMSGELCSDGLSDFEQSYGKAMKGLIDNVPLVELGPCNQMAGIKVSQLMVTPKETWREDLVEDDLPYAGYLSYTFFLNEWNQDHISLYHFSFGIVGPSSGAEVTQTLFHKLIGNPVPKGWKHQLEDEWMVGIGHYLSKTQWKKPVIGNNKIDLSTSFGWDIGNFYTGAALGIMFRYGYNFPTNGVFADGFSPGGISTEYVGTTDNGRYGWSLNLMTFLNAVATVHFIDSAENHTIERRLLFSTNLVRMNLYVNRFQFTFSLGRAVAVVNDYPVVNGWGGLKLTRIF